MQISPTEIGGLALIAGFLALAQRLGAWEDKTLARCLGVLSAILFFVWCFVFLPLAIAGGASLIVLAIAIRFVVKWLPTRSWPRIVRRKQTKSRLAFQSWHAGYGSHPTHVDSGSPSWVSVRNEGTLIPIYASNVICSMEWRNDGGTRVVPVPDVDWYVVKAGNDGWRRSVGLDGGEDQSFVLFIQQPNGLVYACKGGLHIIEVLEPGHWTATMRISSDSVDGFEGTLGFTILSQGGISNDSPAFVILRGLPPRLPLKR